MLAHVGALSTKSNVEAGRSVRSAGSVQPNRGASTLGSLAWSPPSQELSRRQMRALLVLVSVPRRPSWHEIYVVMPDFRGANRERCVSYATLRWLSKKCIEREKEARLTRITRVGGTPCGQSAARAACHRGAGSPTGGTEFFRIAAGAAPSGSPSLFRRYVF